ncbi:MAG: nucleotide exchange factor GrpE [Bacteroidales bacterium]|nr:nucleotide exchange factor GrpE [Bacteroidales bacterium]
MSKRKRHHSSYNKEVKMEEQENTELIDEQKAQPEGDNADDKTSETDNSQDKSAANDTDTTAQDTDKGDDLQKKYDELNDRYLRLMAEFDNYRKRTLKEKMDLTKYAEEDVIKGILPVVDNMERAIKSLESATDVNAVKEGIDLIYKKFKEFLEKRGIKEIEALNKELDTDLHEAVTKFAAPSEDLKGKIIDVIEKGYYLHDKVIRYAKVVVGE